MNKRMKRNYPDICRRAVVIVGLLLPGCTGGLVEETMPEASRPVELRFAHPGLGVPAATRAVDETAPLPPGATIRIAAYRRGEAGEATTAVDFSATQPFAEATYVVGKDGALSPSAVDADGGATDGTAGALAVRSGLYDFYAVSPARPLAKPEGASVWKTDSLHHKEDVMISFARGVTISSAAREVTLATFRRRCAQVVFTVAPSPKNVVALDSLRGIALCLTTFSTSPASLTAGESTVIPPTGGDRSECGTVLFDSTEFVPLAAGVDTAGLGLNKVTGAVLPKTGTPFHVAVTVKYNANPVTLHATIGQGEDQEILFEEGKRYIFTLQVENYLSRLWLNVVDWLPVTIRDDQVGGPDPDTPTDPEITPGTTIGLVVAEWINIDWNDNTVGNESDSGE